MKYASEFFVKKVKCSGNETQVLVDRIMYILHTKFAAVYVYI